MTQALYTVDLHEGVWNVILLGRRFGPYSGMDAAMHAAMNAARKAEIMGYEAMVVVKSDEEAAPPASSNSAIA